ncbi:hypothetical protein BLOT_001795 [Blomia tropicalis]|nr:hypothetical protein BLOT_001795 [Blomia tropicalis]
MTVRAEFNGPFNGIVFSKGTYGQSKCVYVKPHSALTHITFNVRYDECGTKPDLQGKYFENTIVIQYGTDIIEALDEAKRLRCEWFEAYEKPATFRPAIPVADLDIIEMNFQGDEIDCWMSIQEGKGPMSSEISRIVTVGQPLSIVVAINDHKNQFDMKVKSCFAHDGIKTPIYLIDEDGCVLRPKMISPFKKVRNNNGKASLISYAQFLAFKFPDSVDVLIQCTVEVCRHGCASSCETDRISHNIDDGTYRSKPNNKGHAVNRILIENNADLLESASTNLASSVSMPTDGQSVTDHGQHQRQDNNVIDRKEFNVTTKSMGHDLNDIAAFIQQTVASPNGNRVETIKPQSNNAGESIYGGKHKNVSKSKGRPSLSSSSSGMGPMGYPPMMMQSRPEPVVQVLNIPLSPMYMPAGMGPVVPVRPVHGPIPNMLNPFESLKMSLKSKSPRLPQLISNYFGQKRRNSAQYVPNDNFQFITSNSNHHHNNGPFPYRTKRYVRDKQSEVGLKRGFQVVTSLDLSFAPNMSDSEAMADVYEGRIPSSIVYGICFSTLHIFYFMSGAFLLLLVGVGSCVYIICRMERIKRKSSLSRHN